MSDRILVTGGAGFIGSHLVQELAGQGREVRVLDNLHTGKLSNLDGLLDRVDFIQGDIRDLETCRRAVTGCGLVFHLAALASVPGSVADPATSHAVNVTGTLNLLEAARTAGTRRFVFASSTAVYGDAARLPTPESAPAHPLSPYALQKWMAERYVSLFERLFGIQALSLRYFNVFGPRQDAGGPYAAVIPVFMAAAAAGMPVTVYGDGEQSRDFIPVENVVRANLLALSADSLDGQAVNIGTGKNTSVNALIEVLESVTGNPIERVHVPARPGEIRHSAADVQRAGELLGYRTEVDLVDGMERTWHWYRMRRGA